MVLLDPAISQINSYLSNRKASPGRYNLCYQSCTDNVQQALAGGIYIPPATLPSKMFDEAVTYKNLQENLVQTDQNLLNAQANLFYLTNNLSISLGNSSS